MPYLIPIPFLIVTVVLLVRAELRLDQRSIYILKPLSTLLVISVALLSFLTPGVQPWYTLSILLALVFSLGGDLALMFKSARAFQIGLVLFLLAHVVYTVAFTLPNGFQPQDLITGTVLLILAVVLYLYISPGLGSMRGPVVLYTLVITLMVNRGISTFFGDAFSLKQAWLISVGAVLFWLSDLVLAVNRFGRPFRYHKLSLLLYYGGQLLIALSPSYFL